MMKLLTYTFAFLVLALTMGISFSTQGKTRERLEFDLKLGFVKGGEAVMIIKDTAYNGNPAKLYHLKGRTTGVTDKVFNVNNEYESIIDAKTYLPYKSIRNAKERKYRYYNEVFFYHDIDSAYSQKSGWIKTPHNLTDFLTVFFYFVNTYPMDKIGDKNTELYTLHGHEVSLIKVRLTGTEQVETKMGMVDCYVVSPIMEKGKVLKRADGVRFYISREGKFPVQLDFETKVGTLRAVLQSYKINGREQIKN
ncbi:MAG TPA: DUF3108 domain-containing protein [Prolixibacteraceae bacterium]|nr:DUF3108 domain-containing protein [Prolixibacteraceae bacterium]